MLSDRIVAVEPGGAQLRTALCTPDGAIHERKRAATRARDGREAAIERICQAAALAHAEVGNA